MKSMFTRALMAVLAIIWAISAQAGPKDDGATEEEGIIKMYVSPSCVVLGAPVEVLTINTDLDLLLVYDEPEPDPENPQEPLFKVTVNEAEVSVSRIEADARGELVVQVDFLDVCNTINQQDPEMENAEIGLTVISQNQVTYEGEYPVRVHIYNGLR